MSLGTDKAKLPPQIAVNVQAILSLIDKLNVDKSLGPDGTCLRIVKELNSEIGELLAKKCSLQRDVVLEMVAVPPQSARGTAERWD